MPTIRDSRFSYSTWATACFATFALVTMSSQCGAQAYPTKPVRIIVPAVAGSPPDVQTRWLAERLAPALGQSIVIDNRPGAGGTIGARAGAASPNDGYALMYVHQGTLAFNPHLYARPGYDALGDFAPISRFLSTPLALTVSSNDRLTTLADLVRSARERPGQLAWGSAPIGTPPHMAGELFRRTTGIEVTLVPFKASAILEVVGGHVGYTIDIIGTTLPQARAGKVRVLAVTSAKRIPTLPDVPTFVESGYPDLIYETWAGLVAPTGTPQVIVNRLAEELGKIMAAPISREWTAANGFDAVSDTPEAFATLIRIEHAKWGDIIRRAGIKLE